VVVGGLGRERQPGGRGEPDQGGSKNGGHHPPTLVPATPGVDWRLLPPGSPSQGVGQRKSKH
jgi:hypothetical protein